MEELKKLYYDPKTGFRSADQLYSMLKGSVKHKDIKAFLKNQSVYQLNYNNSKINYFPILGNNPNAWQVDLMFLKDYEKFNKGYGGLMCAINITSRLGYAYPLKSKTSESVATALKDFLDKHKNVSEITTDSGLEFNNKYVKTLLKSKNIKHYFAVPGDHSKMGKVERFNQTLRYMIAKYMEAKNTNTYIDILPDLITNYNTNIHSATGFAPNDVGREEEQVIREDSYEQKLKAINDFRKFNPGDKVRVLLSKKVFDKGRKQWSKRVYYIDSIDGYAFKVKQANGEVLDQPYKHYELQLITEVAEDIPINVEVQEVKKKKTVKRRLRKEGIDESNIMKGRRERKKK